MSFYNNTITIVGRLGGDPELRETPTGTVANFSMAVDRNSKEGKEVDWFRVEAWHNAARGVEKNLSKGDKAIVFGCFKVQKDEESKKTYYKIIARNIGYDLNVKEEDVVAEDFEKSGKD